MKPSSLARSILAVFCLTLSISQTARAEYDITEFRSESYVSGFGFYLSPDSSEVDNAWGGGLAFDFFFNENLGVSFGGAWADADTGNVWQTYTADLVLRYPVKAGGLAPYVFVGAGVFDADGAEMLARGGAGLDIRFLPIPLFFDWIYTFVSGADDDNEATNFQVVRFGTRFFF